MKEEFEIVRKNVLANPNLYGGRYTQNNKKDAYIEFLEDKLGVSNARRKILEDKLRDAESLKTLLEDLKVEVEGCEQQARYDGSSSSTEYYKELGKRIDEELRRFENES